MALLDDMKILLRISNTAYDVEINDLIGACKLQLQIDGISEAILDSFIATPSTDDLLKRAFNVYVKANFGWDNKDSEKLNQMFDSMRDRISMSLEYAYFEVTINTTEQQPVIFNGEEKETNDLGTVIFYSRAKNNVEYEVANVKYYVDITADTIIEVI